jgi:hypothetical protein
MGVIVLANQLDADSMTTPEPPLPNLLDFIAEGQGILSLAGARTARRSLSGTESLFFESASCRWLPNRTRRLNGWF